MPRGDQVLEAVRRWERQGLVDEETASRLREEQESWARGRGRRASQLVLAVAGGAVLLVAAGVLTDWLWPLMDRGSRALALAVVGILVHFVGTRMEDRERWLPASWALQTAGLLVLLGAFLYSEQAWNDTSLPGIVVGIAALLVPLLTAPRALDRNPVMPAVHLALAPAFLAVFLDRATPLSPEAIVWIVDGFLLLATVLLLRELARTTDPDAVDRRLHAFVVALYAGLALVIATATVSLELGEDTLWAVDAWWAGVLALTLWAIHRAPPRLQRAWYGNQLAGLVLLGIPLAFMTTLELLDMTAEGAAVAVGALGGAALAYGIREDGSLVVRAGALALVVAAWYYGVERGGALGAVVALAFTAALLLWLSVRLGGDDEEALEGLEG
ncbi:MAG TPA: DUF2157 domain-containing protein [Thermoanaerobaculia bacterium]